MNIGLILDTSALLAHVRLERVSAGELIGEVTDNGDITGVPALAVLDALPQLKGADRGRLVELVTGDNLTVVVLTLVADDLLEVERVAALITGGNGAAQAIVEAQKHGAILATAGPQVIGIGVVIDADDVCELS